MLKTKYLLLLVLLLSSGVSSCEAQEKETTNQTYTFQKGDPNGIGKWYMGREIAYVMGFQGIEWLNRSEREQEERTNLLIKNMDIKADEVLADIGAGSGYHVFKMAPLVNNGLVYAVDIQEEMLQAIEEQQQQKNIKNIRRVKGGEQSANLPANSIDKVLMVDVYHEFNYPK